jgi:hypothetical protein
MGFTGYADDLEAINVYILSFNVNSKPPNNPKSDVLKQDWINWYGSLSWTDMNMSRDNWIKGRQKRDAFNLALGFTPNPGSVTAEEIWPNGVPGAGLASGYTQTTSIVKNTMTPLLILGSVGILIYMSTRYR